MLAATLLSLTIPLAPGTAEPIAEDLPKPVVQLLKEARKELKAKDSDEAYGLLMQVRRLVEPDPEAPSVEIAEVLALGADHPEMFTRRSGLEELLQGRHQGTAIEAAIQAAQHLDDDLDTLAEPFEANKSGVVASPRAGHVLYSEAYDFPVQALAAFDDDRCVAALVDVVGRKPQEQTQSIFLVSSEALIATGTQDGIEAVIEAWQAIEKKARKKPYKGVGGLLADATPNELSAAWSLQPPGLLALRRVHDALAAHLLAEQLPEAPPWDAKTKDLSSAWKAWWKTNGEALPESIGELPADVPAAPTRVPGYLFGPGELKKLDEERAGKQ